MEGINTDFTLEGPRSMYGATKLCSELIIQEYAELYGLRVVINRCGVIAGPWQFGKVDQGVICFWLLTRMLHEIDENYLFLFHIENCVQEKPIVTHI